MEHYIQGVCCAAVLLMSSACAMAPKVNEEPVSGKLQPMLEIPLTAGYTQYYRNLLTGEDASWTITNIDSDGVVKVLHQNGCGWSDRAEWFSPVLDWERCGHNPDWHSGKHIIKSTSGSLWPLTVGNTSSYRYDSINRKGRISSESRNCEVAGTARISVPMGTFDTYKVQCKDSIAGNIIVRTWYLSPGIGEVKHTRVSSANGVLRNTEAVRIEKL